MKNVFKRLSWLFVSVLLLAVYTVGWIGYINVVRNSDNAFWWGVMAIPFALITLVVVAIACFVVCYGVIGKDVYK